MRVCAIGDNVCDQYVPAMMMYPGGQAMNFAVYAKMLGADSAYIGVFGTDRVADHVIHTLDKHEIDRSHARQYEGENGYARVELRDGDRHFLFSNKGGIVNEHPIVLDKHDLDYLRGFDLIYTSNNGKINDQLPVIRKNLSIPIGYDFSGFRWKDPEFVQEVIPYIDYAFLSVRQEEEELVLPIVEQMRSAGVRMVILTLGSLGERVYSEWGVFEHTPKKVDAIDTLGAGDSFATGFLVYLMTNGESEASILEAMRQGEKLAAKTCMTYGAYGEGIPFEIGDEGNV